MNALRPIAIAAAVLLSALSSTGCASGTGTRADALERTLYDYSGAIRWNNFEAAYDAIDPKTRQTKPLSDFELERLKQVQVTSYTVVASLPTPDGGVAREVELRVVNRHTQAERVVRVRESWRYDEEAQKWWQIEGLPNFAQDR